MWLVATDRSFAAPQNALDNSLSSTKTWRKRWLLTNYKWDDKRRHNPKRRAFPLFMRSHAKQDLAGLEGWPVWAPKQTLPHFNYETIIF